MTHRSLAAILFVTACFGLFGHAARGSFGPRARYRSRDQRRRLRDASRRQQRVRRGALSARARHEGDHEPRDVAVQRLSRARSRWRTAPAPRPTPRRRWRPRSTSRCPLPACRPRSIASTCSSPGYFERRAKAPQTQPFQLHIANSIWGQHGLALQAPFLDTLATNYGAGLYVLDFADDPDGSRGTINNWVASETDDKIPKLLGPGVVTSDTKVVLTDAIYFDAGWLDPFDPSATKPA